MAVSFMQGQHFRGSLRKSRKGRAGSKPGLCLAPLLAAALISFPVVLKRPHSSCTFNQSFCANPETPAGQITAAMRPVYPYSVLPGGAYDAREPDTKLEKDDVAARHYSTFDRAHVTTLKSSSERKVYVSYRRGHAIYWTAMPVRLAAGELLLSDGLHYARARCGNRISETPQQPTEKPPAAAPSEQLLDTPEAWEPALPASVALSVPGIGPPSVRNSSPVWEMPPLVSDPIGAIAVPPIVGGAAPGAVVGGAPGSGAGMPGQSPPPAPPGGGSGGTGQPPPKPGVPSVPGPGRPIAPTRGGPSPGGGGGTPPPGGPAEGPKPSPSNAPNVPITVVPEPASLILLATTIVVIAGRHYSQYRTRRAKAADQPLTAGHHPRSKGGR